MATSSVSVTTAINKLAVLTRDLAALKKRIEVIEAMFGKEPPRRPMAPVPRYDASVLLAKVLGAAKQS